MMTDQPSPRGVDGADRPGAVRILRLEGAPYERGVALGAAVRSSLLSYWDQMCRDVGERAARAMSPDALRAWVRERAAAAEEIEPVLAEEIRGIAEGARVDVDIAWAHTFGEEIGDLATMLGEHAHSGRCLGLVVPPDRSETGRYLLAQTWDTPTWSDDPCITLVDDEAGRSAFVADPGWIGGPGVNAAGLASVHTSVLTRENPPGLPYPFLSRMILRSRSVAEAGRAVTSATNTTGCHFLIAGDGTAVDVCIAGDASDQIAPEERPYSTAQHFEQPELAKLQQSVPGSSFRVDRLLELANNRERIGPLDVFGLYADHQADPAGHTVCWHPMDGAWSGGLVVVEAGSRTLWAKAGTPCEERPITRVETPTDGGEPVVTVLALA